MVDNIDTKLIGARIYYGAKDLASYLTRMKRPPLKSGRYKNCHPWCAHKYWAVKTIGPIDCLYPWMDSMVTAPDERLGEWYTIVKCHAPIHHKTFQHRLTASGNPVVYIRTSDNQDMHDFGNKYGFNILVTTISSQ